MKKELPYFRIEGSYGGNQDWFREPMMRLGGCGAETACDAALYMTLYKDIPLYPFDEKTLTKRDYRKFAKIMKPYLSPRMSGIDHTSIWVDGFSKYLTDKGISGIRMIETQGDRPADEAFQIIKDSIDRGLPVAMLMLMHQDKRFHDFEWHWFTVNGYDERENSIYIKAVTYSQWTWLPFERFWNTGKERKGGFVTYHLDS